MSAVMPINIDVIDNTPVISTLVAASNMLDEGYDTTALHRKNRHVLKLLDTHISDFEEFGKVRFQIAPSSNSKTNQNIRIAILNEEQYFLLMTYQRNTKKVREFKINATKAFFAMKKKLYGSPTTSLPQLDGFKDEIKAIREEQEEIRHIMSEDVESIRRMTHLARTATIACNRVGDYLADMPMDKGQLSVLRMSVENRGAELASQIGISRDSAIAGVFRVMNKHFGVGSYHEISREEFYRACLFVKTAML